MADTRSRKGRWQKLKVGVDWRISILVTSKRADGGRSCPVDIVKEVGFYSWCHGKTLESFKKNKKHDLIPIIGLKLRQIIARSSVRRF